MSVLQIKVRVYFYVLFGYSSISFTYLEIIHSFRTIHSNDTVLVSGTVHTCLKKLIKKQYFFLKHQLRHLRTQIGTVPYLFREFQRNKFGTYCKLFDKEKKSGRWNLKNKIDLLNVIRNFFFKRNNNTKV